MSTATRTNPAPIADISWSAPALYTALKPITAEGDAETISLPQELATCNPADLLAKPSTIDFTGPDDDTAPHTHMSDMQIDNPDSQVHCLDAPPPSQIGTEDATGIIQIKLHPRMIFAGDTRLVTGDDWWSMSASQLRDFHTSFKVSKAKIPRNQLQQDDVEFAQVSFLEYEDEGKSTAKHHSDGWTCFPAAFLQSLVSSLDENATRLTPKGNPPLSCVHPEVELGTDFSPFSGICADGGRSVDVELPSECPATHIADDTTSRDLEPMSAGAHDTTMLEPDREVSAATSQRTVKYTLTRMMQSTKGGEHRTEYTVPSDRATEFQNYWLGIDSRNIIGTNGKALYGSCHATLTRCDKGDGSDQAISQVGPVKSLTKSQGDYYRPRLKRRERILNGLDQSKRVGQNRL